MKTEIKKHLQTVPGISDVRYSGKKRRFYYTVAGKQNSITYTELEDIIQRVHPDYHFHVLR